MLSYLILITTVSWGIRIIMSFSPLSLGFWILILSFLISIIISRLISRWFGFIIFLIYIGGILVMFAYFVTIQPNQKFNLKTPFFFFILRVINFNFGVFPVLSNLLSISNWWVSSLFFFNNIVVIILLGFVLFLALIIVVKVTTFYISSLRPFNYV